MARTPQARSLPARSGRPNTGTGTTRLDDTQRRVAPLIHVLQDVAFQLLRLALILHPEIDTDAPAAAPVLPVVIDPVAEVPGVSLGRFLPAAASLIECHRPASNRLRFASMYDVG